MDIKVFAEKVADVVSGLTYDVNVSVQEVVKNNNVKYTGIVVREIGSAIGGTIYINDMYEKGYSVERAGKEVMEIVKNNKKPDIDVNFFKDYEQVKDKLRAKLVNISNEQYAGISAAEYGYDDLKIVPYVKINFGENSGSINILDEHVKTWNVDIKDIVKTALENIKDDYDIQSMSDFLGAMGMPGMDTPGFDIVTNSEKMYGAIGVIAAKETLHDKYPEGYTVIPSSVHEMLVLDKRLVESGGMQLANMIKEVNASCVAPEEILGDHEYTFV